VGVVEHTEAHDVGMAAVMDVHTGACTAGAGPACLETVDREVVVGIADGWVYIETAHQEADRIGVGHCLHMAGLAEVDAVMPEVLQTVTASVVGELGAGADWVEEVYCEAWEAVEPEDTAGSDTVMCCMVGSVAAEISAVVVPAAERGVAVGTLRWAAVWCSRVAGPARAAASVERWQTVRSAMPVPAEAPTCAAASHLASAHFHERHSGQAAGSLLAARASARDAVTSGAA
jgi:hypothetical protein